MNQNLLMVPLVVLLLTAPAIADGLPGAIVLPAPETSGGKPLMQALQARRSIRSYSSRPLPAQQLSNLLWAAFGINRPDTGGRTAPSAKNRQTIDIYVATADALYRYNAKAHTLWPIVAGDLRPLTGMQAFVRQAPVNLIYVADLTRNKRAREEQVFDAAADTGFIGQNVYLYCASEGLATVVRGAVDRAALAKAMKLRPDQEITLCQTVGYPAVYPSLQADGGK